MFKTLTDWPLTCIEQHRGHRFIAIFIKEKLNVKHKEMHVLAGHRKHMNTLWNFDNNK